MSTILRIGSLMKVGFGAAGVEIIRNNLAKGESKDGLVLNTQGTTVKCIFLFCDIRQFTDATESLQEEVFVFTNKIASVIHSICNSYGGSANKNVGDAFLMSWLLSDETSDGGATRRRSSFGARNNRGPNRLTRIQIKADSALLAVIKISIALYNDKFFLEDMTETKRGRLMKKIAKRMGPVVQMGFGLHCGKAVQGAIGTQRKLDATYVSDAVEFAEFLESSTKQFKVNMLMSDAFEGLLSPQVQRRCRKVDQILILEDDMDPDDPDLVEIAEKVDLYTYDMDIDELWRHRARARVAAMRFGGALDVGTTAHSSPEFPGSSDVSGSIRPGSMNVTSSARSRREIFGGKKGGAAGGGPSDGQATGSAPAPKQRRRTSLLMGRPKQNATPANITGSIRTSGGDSMIMPTDGIEYGLNERGVPINMPDLTLPSGRTRYSLSSWNSEDMRVIRKRYSEGLFFPQFHAALQAYYARDWDRAGETFSIILDRFEDGPSRYFLNQIQAHDGVPPRRFIGYNVV
jgi:class 3 adenylate cyclase